MRVTPFDRRLFVLCLAITAAVYAGRPSAVAPPPSGVAALRDVMVPMRDGVTLATDVYLPTVNGAVASEKVPAILERTPYNKDGGAGTGSYFVSHGYAYVTQDVRGRYKSGGHWRPIADDPYDGADTA